MKIKYEKCGKELTEKRVIETKLDKICNNYYLNHVYSEGYEMDYAHLTSQ